MNIGETLRTARESAGLSVEDIINSTHMTARKVECLEKNAFDDSFEFSAPVYVKGFIRSYARAVGIDPEPLVREYVASVSQGGPMSKKPVVPMEATEPRDGSFQRVMAKIPARERDNFAIPVEQGSALEKRVAEEPVARPVVRPAPGPVPVVAKPQPATKPAEAPVADDLFSALAAKPVSDTEPTPAGPVAEGKNESGSAPVEPAKRVAPIEHGVQPLEPPEKAVRNGVRPHIVPDPVPVRKPTDDEKDGDAFTRDSKTAPTAPKPVPLTVPPFTFPGSDTLIGKAGATEEWALSGGMAPTPLVPPAETKPAPKAESRPIEEETTAEKEDDPSDIRTIMSEPAPNPVSLFFTNIRHSVSEYFERKRIERMGATAASDTGAKPGLRLTKTGKLVFGSLAAVLVLIIVLCLIPSKGTTQRPVEPEPYVEIAEDEEAAEPETTTGPTTIYAVLPAPISFAK